jgi:ribosomal protein S18 acetylase RimI-like enzyme
VTGSALATALIAMRAVLAVESANAAALALYERHGFDEIGRYRYLTRGAQLR